MKKMFLLLPLAAAALLIAPASYADRDDWGGHGHGHHHGHHGHHGGYYPQPQVVYAPPAQVIYAPAPQVYYAPQPQVQYYQQQPQYYAPPPRYSSYADPRSHQGLAGGVIGSVLGYEIGNGDPIAAGLGAAAGSFLGNGVGRY